MPPWFAAQRYGSGQADSTSCFAIGELMTMNIKQHTLVGIALFSACAFSAGSAMAGARIWDNTVSTCTTTNCSSLTIPGTVTNPASNNDPFTIQVFASANQCVRLDLTSSVQGVDLETTVTAPNGSIYRNDDGSGGGVFNNPLVKINPTPSSGWYTVTINNWAGTASYADFVLAYGRYSVNNANCSSATVPAFAASPAMKMESINEPVLTPGVGTVSAPE
jgi:hypothetical protein